MPRVRSCKAAVAGMRAGVLQEAVVVEKSDRAAQPESARPGLGRTGCHVREECTARRLTAAGLGYRCGFRWSTKPGRATAPPDVVVCAEGGNKPADHRRGHYGMLPEPARRVVEGRSRPRTAVAQTRPCRLHGCREWWRRTRHQFDGPGVVTVHTSTHCASELRTFLREGHGVSG
ncbi:unnamed protein product [Trichogramma brassicae]|uniref:Uncharacterized protein n=1 Tax=Trichogramma brassicae TaxID=86971 RepID=A0A6H5I3J4_9HYME|nr:unnamed protein product [Trichogramma brassicae]